ncbi:MERTK [Branchiostoma lanceolatum]|uniref:receptor protein-tyrosine kinase n=1 Tax=Branchiostoma lanceolatum TaxID=7740 RepID=A0A8J9ZXZ5_BRALA|nr:MERTK [Branchiostoma lanceolatum]
MAMALFMNSFVITIVSVLSQCTALQFTTHPQRREITAGNPATFVCGVRDSSVHPQVAWLKDGEVLPPGDHYEVDTANYTTGTALTLSSLDFSQTTIADRGFYRCKAWHRDAVIFSEIAQLVVFGPPTIVNNPRSLNVTPNTPFSLQCEAVGPPEPISIAWYKDGEVVAAALPSPSTYSFAGVTTRTRIRCVAENRNGMTPSEFSIVNIIVAPSVPSSLAVSDATSTSLRVSWYLSQDGYSPVTHAIVEFAETSNKGPDGSLQWNRTKVETSSPNSVVIYNLKPYTSYTIHVALENDIGQSGWSDYVVGRTAEGVPSAAPGSIQIQPSGSGADMEVSWSHVATADVNGILQGYRVGFTDAAAGGELDTIWFESDGTDFRPIFPPSARQFSHRRPYYSSDSRSDLSPRDQQPLQPPFLHLSSMYGAGKRKTRPPARFVLSPTEEPDEHGWHSTPAARLTEQLHNELLDVSKQIEQMKTDLGIQEAELETAKTPLPISPRPREDDVTDHRSIFPGGLAAPSSQQDGRSQKSVPVGVQRRFAPPHNSVPTLREVRAFHALHSNPPPLAPRLSTGQQASDGALGYERRPPPENLQSSPDGDPLCSELPNLEKTRIGLTTSSHVTNPPFPPLPAPKFSTVRPRPAPKPSYTKMASTNPRPLALTPPAPTSGTPRPEDRPFKPSRTERASTSPGPLALTLPAPTSVNPRPEDLPVKSATTQMASPSPAVATTAPTSATPRPKDCAFKPAFVQTASTFQQLPTLKPAATQMASSLPAVSTTAPTSVTPSPEDCAFKPSPVQTASTFRQLPTLKPAATQMASPSPAVSTTSAQLRQLVPPPSSAEQYAACSLHEVIHASDATTTPPKTYSKAGDRYIDKETGHGATQGPFQLPPFGSDFITSPLQTAQKLAEDFTLAEPRVEDVRSSNSVILRGLDPTTNYSVQVWALTQVGDGVRSNPIMLYGTGSGGSFVVGYPAEDTVPSNDMASGNQWSVKKMDLVIGGSIAGLILTMVVMTYACCKCHRKRQAKAGKRDPETASTVPMMQHNTPIKSKAAKSFSKKLAAEVQSFRLSPNLTESVVSVLLNRERLEVGKVVGEGEFGCVTEAKLRLEGNRYMTVAVKTMKSRSSKQDVESFVTEALRMKDFHHPNIMSLIGLIMEPPETRFLPVKAMVVLPFMKHGDLHTFLLRSRLADKPKFVPIQTLLKFSVDIAKGMEYLGQMEFLHRDLAARNCMLDEQLVVKVADFGLSRKIYCENYYRQGSMVKVPVKWLAMESLADRVYTTQSDVWSFGVTLWEIITRGATPYPGVANHEVYDLLLKGLRLQKPRDCSDQLYQIMYSCWRINPKHRPSFNFLVRKLHTMLSAMPPPPSIDNSFYENTSNVIKLTDSEACFQDTEC